MFFIPEVTATGVLHRAPTEATYPDGSPMVVPEEEWETADLPLFTVVQVQADEPLGENTRHEVQRFRVSTPLDAPKPGFKDRVALPGFESGGLFHVDGEPVDLGETNPFMGAVAGYGVREIYLVRRRL